MYTFTPVHEAKTMVYMYTFVYMYMSYNMFTHMQVLSSSVANALRVTLRDQAAATAHFCEMFDKFFDCLNVSNFDAGKRSRNVFKSPYRSGHDFRLKVLFYACNNRTGQ